MALQHLDLSYNSLQGLLPASWVEPSSGRLAFTLTTLLMNSNQLSGVLPDMSGMLALDCWSVSRNWLMCGPMPTSAVCGDTNGTTLGEWQRRLLTCRHNSGFMTNDALRLQWPCNCLLDGSQAAHLLMDHAWQHAWQHAQWCTAGKMCGVTEARRMMYSTCQTSINVCPAHVKSAS
jgi:hypothetical protein